MLVMTMLSAQSSQLVVLSAHVTKDTQEMDSAAVVSLPLCCTGRMTSGVITPMRPELYPHLILCNYCLEVLTLLYRFKLGVSGMAL